MDLENQFGGSFRARWCLLVPVGEPRGAHWCLKVSLFLNPLVPVGACWCLLVPVGAWWCLLGVPVGAWWVYGLAPQNRQTAKLGAASLYNTAWLALSVLFTLYTRAQDE